MLRQLAVQIPESQWPDIVDFLSLSLDDLQKLVDYVSNISPTPDVEDIAEGCAEASHLSSEIVEATLSICINLSRLHRNLDKPLIDTLKRVSEALSRAEFPEWEDKQEQSWVERQPYLEALLKPNGAIEIMSKARELLYDFQSVFLNSNVLTDVRYIYDDGPTQVKGALVLHTLSLEYFEGMEPCQVHITLSSRDVERLISQLQRSQRKFEVSETLLKDEGVPELTPGRNV